MTMQLGVKATASASCHSTATVTPRTGTEIERPSATLGWLLHEIGRVGVTMVRERNAAMGGRAEQKIEIAEGADIEGARVLVKQSLRPAPQWQIAQWLAALRLITAHRESDPAEAGAAIKIYVQRLAEWPADCVHEAILHRRWRFFPALAELEDACQELAAPRKLLALQLCTGAGGVHRLSEAQRPDPQTTEQRRAAAQRIMREVFGSAQGPEGKP